MKTLKFLFFGLALLFITSCSKQTSTSELDKEKEHQCHSAVENKYDLLGIYHNEILSIVKDLDFKIESCTAEEFAELKIIMDEIINSNPDYDAIFSPNGDWESINPQYHTVDFPVCEIETPEQLVEISENLVSDLSNQLQLLDIVTETEEIFLQNVLMKLISLNPGDVLDLEEEFQFVDNNLDLFFRDGEFTYTILSVMKYSYCYWNNEYNDEKEIATRRLWGVFKKWIGIKGPIGDVIGAYSSGIRNLYETGGYYDPNRDLFEEMGNGALEGSLGVTSAY